MMKPQECLRSSSFRRGEDPIRVRHSGSMTEGEKLDIGALRADTPGCERVTHLNNAGAALPARPVIDAVTGHLELESLVGGYEAADRAAPAVERFYDAVAGLVGAGRDE